MKLLEQPWIFLVVSEYCIEIPQKSIFSPIPIPPKLYSIPTHLPNFTFWYVEILLLPQQN